MSSASKAPEHAPFGVDEDEIFKFVRHISHQREFIQLLGRQRLLCSDNIACSDCGHRPMSLQHSSHHRDGFALHCTTHGCSRRVSVRHNSFFEAHSQTDLSVLIDIVRMLQHGIHQNSIAELMKVSDATVGIIHLQIMEKVRAFNASHPIRFTAGEIVELDGNVNVWQTIITRYPNLNIARQGQMIFGMVNRDVGNGKRLHLELVRSENYEDIRRVVFAHADLKCVLMHDAAPAYNAVGDLGYQHHSINKSCDGFSRIDEKTQLNVHVNNIEAVWREKAEWILSRHGVFHTHMEDFIQEFMFVFNRNRFLNLLTFQ